MDVGKRGRKSGKKETELVRKLKSGNEKAFRILLEDYAPLVFSLIDRMVFDRSHREDLAQEIFVKVIEHIGYFREEAKLSSWIYTIAYRHLLDFLKSNKRDIFRKANSIDDEGFFNELRDENVNAEENFARLQDENELVKALNKLPEKYRVPVHLQFIDGLQQKEIADIIGISINGVKTRVRRGLHILREDLGSLCLEE